MTDLTAATVAVPVELLERLASRFGFDDQGAQTEARALLPKPTPRLVAVDLDSVFTEQSFGVAVVTLDLLSDQPDLLSLLDDAIETWGYDHSVHLNGLKNQIRAALGVNE